jgi:hypothetical protein
VSRPRRDVTRAGRARAALYRQPAPLGTLHCPRPRLPRLRTSRDGHTRRDAARIRAARAAPRGRRTPGLVAPALAARRHTIPTRGCLPSVPPCSKSGSYTYKTPVPPFPRAGAPWPREGRIRHRAMGTVAAEPPLRARPSPANHSEPLPGSPRSSPRRALPRPGAGLAGSSHAAPCAAWHQRAHVQAPPRPPTPVQFGS